MIDGTDYVQALMDTLSEHDRAIAMMRDEGMPATITPDLARGESKVAALRFDRDLAKVEWEADRSNCERLKNQAWIVERQIERELR